MSTLAARSAPHPNPEPPSRAAQKGYRQTDHGLIPSDWDVRPIGELCRLINGRGFKPHEWRTAGLPIIRIQNLNGSDDFNYYDGPYAKKLEIEAGQLLFAWSGSRGTSFGPHVWRGALGLLNYHTWKVEIRDPNLDPSYFLHALRQLTTFIEGKAHGASALVHTQKWEMEGFTLVLPSSTTEQQAIAAALSDADALIEGLEKLIEKKRAIKQGAMQELLTGKRRLPGFKGEWVTRPMAEIADCLDNLRVPLNDTQRQGMKGDYPYCGANGILDYINQYCVNDSVILMAEDGGYFDEYATRPIAYRMSGKFWVNNHAHILKAKPEFDQDFIYYSIVHKNILPFLASGTRAKLNKSELMRITIVLPPNNEEQAAIASILSSMDGELEVLDQKLTKARLVKQGMMQELLTGRVRLL